MALKSLLKKPKENLEAKSDSRPKRVDMDSHDDSNWLVSYADMMTLLCGFFIMLFSMAKLDEPQYEKVKEQLAKEFGGDYKSPSKELARFVTQVLEQAGVEKETMIRSDPSGIAITFQSSVFFDTLSSEVSPQGQFILGKLIGAVAERQDAEQKKYKIVVEGHTDNRPVVSGVYPSNWELSGARASRVVRMFLDRGFPPGNLTAIGYADTRPEFAARTPAGELDPVALGKNRRVVVRILQPKVDSIPYPETAKELTVDPAAGPAAPESAPAAATPAEPAATSH